MEPKNTIPHFVNGLSSHYAQIKLVCLNFLELIVIFI